MLERTGLAARATVLARALTIGELKRLEIARALATGAGGPLPGRGDGRAQPLGDPGGDAADPRDPCERHHRADDRAPRARGARRLGPGDGAQLRQEASPRASPRRRCATRRWWPPTSGTTRRAPGVSTLQGASDRRLLRGRPGGVGRLLPGGGGGDCHPGGSQRRREDHHPPHPRRPAPAARGAHSLRRRGRGAGSRPTSWSARGLVLIPEARQLWPHDERAATTWRWAPTPGAPAPQRHRDAGSGAADVSHPREARCTRTRGR